MVFETFLECSLPKTVSKNTVKKLGRHAPLKDMMDQSYPFMPNQMHFISSVHWKQKLLN